MANKPTKKERRELAKRQRAEALRNRGRKRRARMVQTVLAVIVIGGLIGFLVVRSGKNKSQIAAKVNTAATAIACGNVESPSDKDHQHITPPTLGEYSSNPPTSGSHYNEGPPNGPGFTGVNDAPLSNEVQVHNLEHGHIGIQYGASKIKPDVLAKLKDFAKVNKDWVFLAPRDATSLPAPGFNDVLAFTAWDKIVHCGDGVKDDPAGVGKLAQAFYDAYQNKSPWESVVGAPNPATG